MFLEQHVELSICLMLKKLYHQNPHLPSFMQVVEVQLIAPCGHLVSNGRILQRHPNHYHHSGLSIMSVVKSVVAALLEAKACFHHSLLKERHQRSSQAMFCEIILFLKLLILQVPIIIMVLHRVNLEGIC